MKEFVTALTTEEQRPSPETVVGKEVTVKYDGREVTFRGASSGQILAVLAMEGQSERARIATMINYFFSLLKTDSDRAYFKSRLFDFEDPFGEKEISEVLQFLIEEWGGRPTEPSSDLASVQSPTGQSSTEDRQQQATPTLSPFGPTAS